MPLLFRSPGTHLGVWFRATLALAALCVAAQPQSPVRDTGAAPDQAAPAQAAPTPAVPAVKTPALDRPAAIRAGVQRLLEFQEQYVVDEPVGRLSAKRLEAWRTEETARLTKLRAAAGESRSEWPYEGVYRVGEGAIPAGYRVGGSAIVCLALLAAPGYAEDQARQAAVARSVAFILEMLATDADLSSGPKQGYDVRGWGHTYALELLLTLLRQPNLPEAEGQRLKAACTDLLARLAANQTAAGGWNYANNQEHSPFQTGATLLALFAAEAQGFEVDGPMVERALAALQTGRDSDTGAFAYSGPGREPMHASAARAAIAELCLFKSGHSDQAELERALLGFFDGWQQLLARKSKQGTHEGPYAIAPYYFFFGHTYAALAIEALPEERRAAHRQRLESLLAETREPDGTWNDRIFPRSASYGTAMALLALLARDLPAVPAWLPAAKADSKESQE